MREQIKLYIVELKERQRYYDNYNCAVDDNDAGVYTGRAQALDTVIEELEELLKQAYNER
jgi:hypothetical protein